MRSFIGFCAFCLGLVASTAFADGPNYVIITTTNIIQESTQLTNFVASKETRGFEVTVVSNTVTGWGGGTGDAAAENIRAWLQANYTNSTGDYVIDYVLLLGNPHPTTGDVPMKMCRPGYSSTSTQYPTDLYYAELTSDWNVDGDGYFGEWNDRDTNDPPWQAEIWVGRIPYYGNMSDLDSILSKIENYESVEGTNSHWRGDAMILMDGGILSFEEEALGDLIVNAVLEPSGWDSHRVYDNGSPDTTPCNSSTVLSVWTNSSYGSVFWMAHGDSSATGTSGQILDLSDIALLDDTFPLVAYQGSCWLAKPEVTNNLTYALLLNGGVAVIGCTRESTYRQNTSTHDQMELTPGFIYGFADSLIHECQATGPSLFDHKAAFDPSEAGEWVNHLGFNLYGCPALTPYPQGRFAGSALAH